MKHQQSCTPNTGNGGNYYNAGAASAGLKTNSLGEIYNSICPKNWTMPKPENDKSYFEIGSAYKSNSILVVYNPISLIKSGSYAPVNGRLDRGNSGYFFVGKVTAKTSYRHYFYFDNKSITYDTYNQFGYGYALRCVAR